MAGTLAVTELGFLSVLNPQKNTLQVEHGRVYISCLLEISNTIP